MKHLSTNDRANLNFLMTIPDHELLKWFEQASDDDKSYAAELVSYHLLNIFDASIMNSIVDNELSDLKDAQSYLQKFKLKG